MEPVRRLRWIGRSNSEGGFAMTSCGSESVDASGDQYLQVPKFPTERRNCLERARWSCGCTPGPHQRFDVRDMYGGEVLCQCENNCEPSRNVITAMSSESISFHEEFGVRSSTSLLDATTGAAAILSAHPEHGPTIAAKDRISENRPTLAFCAMLAHLRGRQFVRLIYAFPEPHVGSGHHTLPAGYSILGIRSVTRNVGPSRSTI